MMKFQIMGNYARLVAHSGGETVIRIPESYEGVPITEIGPGVFKNDPVVEFVKLPSGLTVINDEAFSGCINLICVNYDVPDSPARLWVETEGGLSSRLPGGVTRIGVNAFRGTVLQILTVQSGELFIASSAFQKSGLWMVRFPHCRKLIIDTKAFAVCENLRSFEAQNASCSLGAYAFAICPELAEFRVKGEPEYCGSSFHQCPKMQSGPAGDGRFTIDPEKLYKFKIRGKGDVENE